MVSNVQKITSLGYFYNFYSAKSKHWYSAILFYSEVPLYSAVPWYSAVPAIVKDLLRHTYHYFGYTVSKATLDQPCNHVFHFFLRLMSNYRGVLKAYKKY